MSYELINRGQYYEAVHAPETRAAGDAGTVLIGVQSRPAYPDVAPAALLAGYRRSEIVFACIQIKALALTDPRLIVQRHDGSGDWQEDTGHPLRRVLMRPNRRMDEAGFWRAYIASMDLVGRFYAQKLMSNAGAIIGLNPLNPCDITPRYDQATGMLTHYAWRSGTQQRDFAPHELLVREPDDWSAPAPLAVALGSVDADAAQTDYIRAFFNNAGTPSGILSTEQELRQPEADALRARWRATYGRGTGNQHDIAVLGKGTSYTRTGANLDELDSESVRGTTESRICMVFGVPPLIVYAYIGLTRATYSNLKEAWASFWDATLSPMLKLARGWLLWSLLAEFESEDLIYGERVRLHWDVSQVAALQEDVDKAQARARDNFKAGAITLNELRAQLGVQPDAAGDYYVRNLVFVPIPFGASADAAQSEVQATRAARYPAAIKALKAASVGSIERRIEKAVQVYLLQEYEHAAHGVGDG